MQNSIQTAHRGLLRRRTVWPRHYAFLEAGNTHGNWDDKTRDGLTDSLAKAFEKGEGEGVHRMEELLSQVLLPCSNKLVRIQGLTEAAELNGRLGVLRTIGSALISLVPSDGGGSAPISLVPCDAAPAVQWLNVKLTALRPASMDDGTEAVADAISKGRIAKFADLMTRPAPAPEDAQAARAAAAVGETRQQRRARERAAAKAAEKGRRRV